MGRRRIPEETIDRAKALIEAGSSMKAACQEVGITTETYKTRTMGKPFRKPSTKVEVVALPNPVTPNAAPVSLALTGEPEAVARFLALIAGAR